MISEFICLKEFQKSECKSTYICSLPDSDLDSDFGMVICGYINIRERIGSKEFLIKIEMLDNFEKLCVGDTYQRERFLTDILYMLRQKVSFDPYHAKILLKDHVGNYVGNAYVLSETVQGRKKYIEISGRKNEQ